MENILNKMKSAVDLENIMSNPLLYGIIAVSLAMYGPRLSPKLPPVLKNLFNNNYFRFAVILLIAYMASKNLQIALIITIALCLATSYASSQVVEEEFMSEVRENFSDFDTIRELKEHFPKDVENKMNLDVQKLNPEKRQEKFEDDEEDEEDDSITFKNYETMSESEPTGQQKCGNDVMKSACVDYCYSQAGFNDNFCKQKFPNPQHGGNNWIDCKKATNTAEKKKCLETVCAVEANKNKEYCKKLNESRNEGFETQNVEYKVQQISSENDRILEEESEMDAETVEVESEEGFKNFEREDILSRLSSISDIVKDQINKYKNPLN